jgi:beta-lactam-binding protein with PASTA domain
MAFIRWLMRLIGGLTQFSLYTLLLFVMMVALSYAMAMRFFGGETWTAPDLTGQSIIEAMETLQPARVSLLMESHQPHVQVPEGHIVSQYPLPGTAIKNGTPIRVVVSDGTPLITVPDLRGQSRIEATIRLRKAGLQVGTVARVPREGVTGGMVLTTDPPAGTGMVAGGGVNLMLSAGEGARLQQMRSLIGLTPDEARDVLNYYGLTLGDATEQPGDSPDIQAGQIYRQSPAAGEAIAPTTRIAVWYQPSYADPNGEAAMFGPGFGREEAPGVNLESLGSRESGGPRSERRPPPPGARQHD